MKKSLATVMATALVLTAMPAMAQPGGGKGPQQAGPQRGGPQNNRPGPGGPSGPNGRFRKGDRFSSSRAPNYAVIDYRRYRGLRQPPRGYHWVRSGNDAVLVAITTGIVASVIAGAIR